MARNWSARGVAHEVASGLQSMKVIPFFATRAIIHTSRILCAAYTYLSCNGLMLVR